MNTKIKDEMSEELKARYSDRGRSRYWEEEGMMEVMVHKIEKDRKRGKGKEKGSEN